MCLSILDCGALVTTVAAEAFVTFMAIITFGACVAYHVAIIVLLLLGGGILPVLGVALCFTSLVVTCGYRFASGEPLLEVFHRIVSRFDHEGSVLYCSVDVVESFSPLCRVSGGVSGLLHSITHFGGQCLEFLGAHAFQLFGCLFVCSLSGVGHDNFDFPNFVCWGFVLGLLRVACFSGVS